MSCNHTNWDNGNKKHVGRLKKKKFVDCNHIDKEMIRMKHFVY